VGDGQDADPHATALQDNCDNSSPPVRSGDGSESEPSLSYLVSERPNADAEHGFKGTLRGVTCECRRRQNFEHNQIEGFLIGVTAGLSHPASEDQKDRHNLHFDGACLDCGAQRSVVGMAQANAYASLSGKNLDLHARSFRFKFANAVLPSIVTIKYLLPNPKGYIPITLDIVDGDVPLLVGLDVLDRHRLVPNNSNDVLERRKARNTGTDVSDVVWRMPLVRRHRHLYIEGIVRVCNFLHSELQRLQKHYIHPSADLLYNLLRRARPNETDIGTRNILEDITKACQNCQMHQAQPRRFVVSASMTDAEHDFCFGRHVDMDLLWI
jgi:hypothetical protein